MRLFAASLVLSATMSAASIPTIAGALSIAASSTTIVRETHNLIRHPIRTLKGHGKALKAAAKGKDAK